MNKKFLRFVEKAGATSAFGVTRGFKSITDFLFTGTRVNKGTITNTGGFLRDESRVRSFVESFARKTGRSTSEVPKLESKYLQLVETAEGFVDLIAPTVGYLAVTQLAYRDPKTKKLKVLPPFFKTPKIRTRKGKVSFVEGAIDYSVGKSFALIFLVVALYIGGRTVFNGIELIKLNQSITGIPDWLIEIVILMLVFAILMFVIALAISIIKDLPPRKKKPKTVKARSSFNLGLSTPSPADDD